jgi:hypothetical protein
VTPLRDDSEGTWLEVFLRDSIGATLCTKIHCTTCGAIDFRRGLLAALAAVTSQQPILRIDRQVALSLCRALSRLPAATAEQGDFDPAVRLVLFELWSSVGEAVTQEELEPILEGTWAGSVLNRMKAHHRERQVARRAYEAFNDPVRVQERRDTRRRLTGEKVAERLALKKERDRLRATRQGKGDA